MTPAPVPQVLVASDAPKEVVDATYFVIRALRNALRNNVQPVVSPESPDGAYALARAALQEIEQAEHADIVDIPAPRVHAYIQALAELSRESFAAVTGPPEHDAGRELLEQLRAQPGLRSE